MLKFMNSVSRCIGFTAVQLRGEIVLNALHLRLVKRYNATCVLQKHKYQSGQNVRLCILNQTSHIPKAVSRNCSNVLTCNARKSSAPVKLDVTAKMSDLERPETNHASTGGSFQISPEEALHTHTFPGDADEPVKKRHCRDGPRIPPDFRVWEPVNKRSGTDGDTFRFKVVSYNVLAQYLLEWHPYLYSRCDTRCLKWNFRSMLLFEEIAALLPDIICLQEVQASHIPTFYKKLEEIGYTGIFKQKTGHRQDGCAIYFKESVFKMKEYTGVEFYQPELPILNRDNIGIMLKLIPHKMPDSSFIVATTHLLFNPRRTDVRLAQLQVFLAEIDRFSFSPNKGKGHLPIILSGDLNSMPDSAVVHLLSSGKVCVSQYRDGSDWKKIGVTDNCQHLTVFLNRQKGEMKQVDLNNLMLYNSDYRESEGPTLHKDMPENNLLFNTGSLGHSLNLKSVYNHRKINGQTEATTFQNEWITVDYIYFSQSGLNLVERLYLPTAKECEVLQALPNNDYGSDHLALGAVFDLKSVKCML